MKKIECAFAVNGVWSGKPFDFATIADSQFGLVEVPDFGEFIGHPFVRRHAVEVATLNHERTGSDQGCHFGVVERSAQIKLKNLIFAGPDIAVRTSRRRVLPHPFVDQLDKVPISVL